MRRAMQVISKLPRWMRAELVAVVIGAVGCSMSADEKMSISDSAGDDDDYGADPGAEADSTGYGANTGMGGGTSMLLDAGTGTGGVPPLPPEEEIENSFRAPVATGRYLWSANPESSYVAVVDAAGSSLDVRIVQAGYGPNYLAPVSDPSEQDRNAAIVLNELSDDATLMRIDDAGQLETETFPTHQGANAWAVSSRGQWAIAWTNAAEIAGADPTEGFQEVTVIPLTGGSEQRLSVGYRPESVAFNQAETRAYVVAEPGITVIDLELMEVTGLVVLTEDPLEDPEGRDVTITPDGSTALVSRQGQPEVRFVDLESGTPIDVVLDAPVTDLDLSEDGTLAVAAVRDLSQAVILPVPGAAEDADLIDVRTFDGETIGSVALTPDGDTALLFTTVAPIATGQNPTRDHLTILQTGIDPGDTEDATSLDRRTVSVQTPVRAVFPADDAEHAIVFQEVPEGSTRAGAFSVVPLQSQIWPKLVPTDAPPRAVAIAPDGEHALVTVRSDLTDVHGVYLVSMPSLRVDLIPLASPPLATGIVPAANKGYVAQEHPEGRITIIDFDSPGGAPRTLTGFELATRVTQ